MALEVYHAGVNPNNGGVNPNNGYFNVLCNLCVVFKAGKNEHGWMIQGARIHWFTCPDLGNRFIIDPISTTNTATPSKPYKESSNTATPSKPYKESSNNNTSTV
ncbi:hypothetical protein C5167_032339 [Papaver somniferum]|uniref:Uncharacterized protein n=1 Tax=Papaver somniferum TaxID=3469 RepID=A0A4Y7K7D3_PAPSO|nr:hypothetical protein C5167_032339 [Papaver somniferum]